MFKDYVYEQSGAKYVKKIVLVDADLLEEKTHFSDAFKENGFEIVQYYDELDFRIRYEERIKHSDDKLVLIIKRDQYIPYDLLKKMTVYTVSLENLFPRLNSSEIKSWATSEYDLLAYSYRSSYDNYQTRQDTERFKRTQMYAKKNLLLYASNILNSLLEESKGATNYKTWFDVANKKSQIDRMSLKNDLGLDSGEINRLFKDYILAEYGKLSSVLDNDGPVLVSRAMEYMHDHSNKFVIIVMDGMSVFDWQIIRNSFADYSINESYAYAMIPTVTSVSRQCLLSNKYPRELIDPWHQSKEKQEFISCAKKLGYMDSQIDYQRGYDVEFGNSVRCGAIIINDIDDMVHGQKQGRIGMLNDVEILAKQGKLFSLVQRLLNSGFDVYISADHGNTLRKGVGRLTGTGVETETKSHCMLVLKDFADKEGLKEKYGMIEFLKTYLPKEFDYLICDVGVSFDINGEEVMTHGGISLDECVVPFIQIKAEENHG